MKVSYRESLADCSGLPRRGDDGNAVVLSVRGEDNAGQVLSSEITTSVCRSCPGREKATSLLPLWRGSNGHGGVPDPVHVWTFQAREPGGPIGFLTASWHITAVRNDQQTSQTERLI